MLLGGKYPLSPQSMRRNMLENAAVVQDFLCFPFESPPSGGTVRLAENLLWIRLPLPLPLDHVNCFAFSDSDGWTVIDTGIYSAETQHIWEQLVAGPLADSDIRRVILTHHHPDHVGMAGWFHSEFGTEIFATRTAWLMARILSLDVQETLTEEGLKFFRRAGTPAELLAKLTVRRPFNFADYIRPLPAGFTRLQDGDQIRFGNENWWVRVGHGHAPSHLTLWSEDSQMVIGGDQFLPDITPNIGVYVSEPDANPLAEFLGSCEQFLEYADSRQLILPGHQRPFLGLPLRLQQLTASHRASLERIRQRIRATQSSAHDIFDILFRRPIGDGEYGLAIIEAIAHMNWLLHAKQAKRDLNAEGVWMYSSSR